MTTTVKSGNAVLRTYIRHSPVWNCRAKDDPWKELAVTIRHVREIKIPEFRRHYKYFAAVNGETVSCAMTEEVLGNLLRLSYAGHECPITVYTR